ncbi:sulfotransferase domain protein [Desulfosarcina variabilis str. Montpellier]|uniref:sulfotransferase domain-containing protein n=1 Tax=Desulfosarcina variabilis TaxID=2300 RepID=UPI003AFA0FD8
MNEIIHIGFSKCASTYLQSIIRANRNINFIYKSKRFAILKENGRSIHEFEITNQKYNDIIVFESDEHIILPSFNTTLSVRGTTIDDVKIVIDKIYRYNKHVKIIMIIRNHFELLASRYSQYIIGAGGTETFDNFIKKLNGFNDDSEIDFFQNFYYEIRRLFQEKFGNNFLLILFEDIKKNSKFELKKVQDFIGTDLELPKNSKNIFTMRKGLSKWATLFIRRLNKLFVIKKQTYNKKIDVVLPISMYFNILRSIRVLDYYLPNNNIKNNPLIVERVHNKFKDDNKKLSCCLNRKIEELGYLL